jgi:hypothetical protein
MASDRIQTGQTDIRVSLRFAVLRTIPIWLVSIIVGIIVTAGVIALIVPGIILGIMFSLVLPVILIEKLGVLESLGRSRALVSHRWLKSFALFLVFGIIIGIATAIVSAISAPFGIASTVVSSILSAFYIPMVPIALTLYYYSNVARIAPPPMSQPPMAAPPVSPMPPPPPSPMQAEMKYCSSCGTQLASNASFCSKCGAKQSV